MKIQLPVKGFSQYDVSINPKLQPSACGPVTVYVLLNYLLPNHSYIPNDLYKHLKGTRIGLFTCRFIRRLKKLLGPGWTIQKCSIEESLGELQQGRPVALKFDKYFSFKWKQKFSFSYHWVPLIGYEKNNDELYLIVHDNGGRGRESSIRKIKYAENAPILTFIKVVPPASVSLAADELK
ncbi:C39 family peptidase [uncultured Psychrobacillus sp.]|uniref:C39 family peptidase n=1 Tax=uncultured Psychrobacillus sp. TaxID=1551585 RepID=UPI002632DF53|nr:C39 family peptidase [uncultured Psychrobacillus sp.]